VQENAFVAITGETEFITRYSSAAIREKVAYIGVRSLLLLCAQVFHKDEGLINKLQ